MRSRVKVKQTDHKSKSSFISQPQRDFYFIFYGINIEMYHFTKHVFFYGYQFACKCFINNPQILLWSQVPSVHNPNRYAADLFLHYGFLSFA